MGRARPRTPTREEKQLIVKHKYDWRNWLVGETDNLSITLINKKSGKRRVILR